MRVPVPVVLPTGNHADFRPQEIEKLLRRRVFRSVVRNFQNLRPISHLPQAFHHSLLPGILHIPRHKAVEAAASQCKCNTLPVLIHRHRLHAHVRSEYFKMYGSVPIRLPVFGPLRCNCVRLSAFDCPGCQCIRLPAFNPLKCKCIPLLHIQNLHAGFPCQLFHLPVSLTVLLKYRQDKLIDPDCRLTVPNCLEKFYHAARVIRIHMCEEHIIQSLNSLILQKGHDPICTDIVDGRGTAIHHHILPAGHLHHTAVSLTDIQKMKRKSRADM